VVPVAHAAAGASPPAASVRPPGAESGTLDGGNRRRNIAIAIGASGVVLVGCLITAMAMSYH
jgi:hypothetical protein